MCTSNLGLHQTMRFMTFVNMILKKFNAACFSFVLALMFFSHVNTQAFSEDSVRRPIRILVLAENGGHHIQYTVAAKVWLGQLAAKNNFSIDYIQNPALIDDAFLKQYQVFIQLDYPPYGWGEKAAKAFENFMQKGRGGWLGFHHATLLGEFDGYPMWNWFSDFMGGIRWKNYIATFSTARVSVEDAAHPCMKGIPGNFIIEREEWYTYDKSPRPNVRVLASVDEDSYQPNSEIKMGDHPVVWTNEKFSTKNLYIFMGHSPDLFQNEVYKRLFQNAILWMAEGK
jgi:uncharacterized protein